MTTTTDLQWPSQQLSLPSSDCLESQALAVPGHTWAMICQAHPCSHLQCPKCNFVPWSCAACTGSRNSLTQSQWPVMSSPEVAGVVTCKVPPHMHWPPKQLLCHHLLSTHLPLPAPANLTAHCPHWAATGSRSIVTFAHLLVVAALLPHAKAAHLCWLAHQLLRPHPHFCAAAGWRSGCCGAL